MLLVRRGFLGQPQALCTHGLAVFQTNQESQKAEVDNTLISKQNVFETHTAYI